MAPDRAMPLLAWAWRHFVLERVQWRLTWLLVAKFVVGVTGIVFDDGGRVLLLKHTFRRKYPWGLVSGWVKTGESLVGALQREIREETSFSVEIDRLFQVRTDRLRLAMEFVYLCRYTSGSFRANNEVTQAQWCSPDAPPDGLHPQHFPLIRAAADAGEANRTADGDAGTAVTVRA